MHTPKQLWNWLMAPADDYQLSSWLFIKGLALVYVAAFLSLAVQIDGLAGADGILPYHTFLEQQFHEQGYWAWLHIPTLFWFNSSDVVLQGAAIAGALLGIFLLLGWGQQRVILILLFVLYLSLYHAGQVFMSFQWDYLLLESGFLAIFLLNAPTRVIIFLYHWLLFRLRFLSGFSKLASGDPTWSQLTTLNHYFETQPLPTIGAWYAHQLPGWLLKAGTGFTLFAELVVPFFIFLPRPFRLLAAAITLSMQILIITTSNHNFFNLLTILLCLFLLDDRIVEKLLPKRLRQHIIAGIQQPRRTLKILLGTTSLLIILVSLTAMSSMLFNLPLSPPLESIARIGPRYGIGNIYHVFPVMQTERQELIIAGSYDGIHWEPYQFRYKPGALAEAPPFNVPHQPRLDWMMWFLPPQRWEVGYWFRDFLHRLQQNSPPVTALLAYNPFADKPPPHLLRVSVFRYRFSTPAEREQTGQWWQAEYLGEFPDVPPRQP